MVYFKENFHFPRVPGGGGGGGGEWSNIFQGSGDPIANSYGNL